MCEVLFPERRPVPATRSCACTGIAFARVYPLCDGSDPSRFSRDLNGPPCNARAYQATPFPLAGAADRRKCRAGESQPVLGHPSDPAASKMVLVMGRVDIFE